MTQYKYTAYFENEVLRKRPYLKKEWCIEVVNNPEKVEKQEDNRFRFWAKISELDNRYLRVITLEDKKTIHNAFPDRRFEP
ncbi:MULTISPECIES: hypothetical protein [Gracilimonas]|uniref:Uncharacterized protein n=1 Tax=Gracilimonas sediminicola TaxID=2952158 RepID=A0A9X2L5N4_9BACT|nr:hypothetical protein [Gracilimonas sediminicola]MCP9292715.1 hypothetical protein [Gracilimonas sediminicola]